MYRIPELLAPAGGFEQLIQDYGLASIIKWYIPDMQIHLSTQGTVFLLMVHSAFVIPANVS